MLECGSKTSTVLVVWATFGIYSARSKWFSVAIGDHGRNLVISLWPEKKQQSMEWRHSSSPRPKNFRVQTSAGKVLPSIFWDQDSILLIDYVSKGQTINAEYYSSLLVQLKDILKEKPRGKVPKAVLFLHDNIPAYWALATQKKLPHLGFQCFDYPAYSPDLAPSDYHLLLGLKNNWKFAIFRPTWRSLLPRRPGWTDNILNFFEWLAKVTATD